MIYDTLDNAGLYLPLGPRFELGLRYLETFDPHTSDGRVPLDGNDVFALVQSYEPSIASSTLFESHRLFIDLHFIAAGEEIIQYAPLSQLRMTVPYSTDNDAALYNGSDDFPLFLGPRNFVFLFPSDGHKPCCLWRSPNRVKKVVIKIRL